MDKTEIGTAAGVVWRALSETNSLTYDELREKCRLHDRLLCAAIGWLAREDKVDLAYDERRNTVICHLIFNIYF